MLAAPLPRSHDAPQQGKNCGDVSKTKMVTLVYARLSQRPAQAVSDQIVQFYISLSSIKATRPPPAVSDCHFLPPSRCHTVVLVKAAPSEITQLPVHAERCSSLILEDGLMLFQKVLPCCAFGFRSLIC